MKRDRMSWGGGLLAVAVALTVGYWWGQSRQPTPIASASGPASARKVLYWYDPMLPGQHFEKPGMSPMGMQLVPRYAGEPSASGIAIDPRVQQTLGIRTVRVRRGHLDTAFRVPGTITWDLREERVVGLPVDVVVRRLDVRAPFESVHAGQPLATLLAPTWSTALAEARALRDARSSAGKGLASAAQARLHVLGIPVGAAGPDGTITLRAPMTGVISEVGVREGQAVAAGTPLFRINGTGSIWLEAAVPQAASASVRTGTPVEASVSALPERRFKGIVEALLPQVDPATRTQRARIVLRNDNGLLVPGMYADVRLQPQGDGERLLVPTDSVIGNGDDAHVIVQGIDGGFRPVPVALGRSAGGETEVLAGLQGDERIVADGQFLVDSEASLAGALERLGPPSTATSHAPTTATPPVAPPGRGPSRRILYWYDPAMPEMHSDHPGTSVHSGQPLLPKYAERRDAP